jgi:hypothetical protein
MVSPTGAPPGKYYSAATNSYILSPPGTYSPGGGTAPITDPGGTYSAAGASSPTLDPSGTYSSPYALNRLIITWENITPANSVLAFDSLIGVENYYGVTSREAALARQFFAQHYDDTTATLLFTREDFGQRPHLLGANISGMTLAQLQTINGPISITFNGLTYAGNVNLASATSFDDAADQIRAALNSNSPILAKTKNSTITPVTTFFTGHFDKAQLTVDSVQSGTVQVGGQIDGQGVSHVNPASDQIIFQHDGAPGGAGTYSSFARIGSQANPEPMTETYGILTIGTVTSGTVAVGQQIVGPGVPPLTAIVGDLGNGQYVVNNAANIKGNFTMRATPLSVQNQFMAGATQNNDFFQIQPNGAFGFNQNPSDLSYASGPVADALGLSQAFGARLSSPGGQHISVANYMDDIIQNETDQYGNPVRFGSFQTNDPRAGLVQGLLDWANSADGLGYEFLSTITTTRTAGQSMPVTDPPGTHSDVGATAPTLDPMGTLLAAPLGNNGHHHETRNNAWGLEPHEATQNNAWGADGGDWSRS